MTPQREEALRLLRLARRDRDTFGLLLPLPQASLAAIGFHAQQAAEKALKAIAALRGLEVRRTHDLAAPGQAVVDSGTAMPLTVDPLRSLDPFAVDHRDDDELRGCEEIVASRPRCKAPRKGRIPSFPSWSERRDISNG